LGAWGTGVFDNDDAQDWLGDLLEEKNINILKDTFQQAIEEEYIEEPYGSCANAAAEVVALILGKGQETESDELLEWVKSITRIDVELVTLARTAIRRIQEDSEIKDLWAESEESNVWSEQIENLALRLK
jgi:hypothetical protein